MEGRSVTLRDRVASLFDVERYGAGVPTALLLFGAAFLVYAIRGFVIYETLTPYGKVGVVTIFVLSLLVEYYAVRLFRSMDIAVWTADRRVEDSKNEVHRE